MEEAEDPKSSLPPKTKLRLWVQSYSSSWVQFYPTLFKSLKKTRMHLLLYHAVALRLNHKQQCEAPTHLPHDLVSGAMNGAD